MDLTTHAAWLRPALPVTASILIAAGCSISPPPPSTSPPEQAWIAQFGTSGPDSATGAATDGQGNTYLVGETSGDVGGPNAGQSDAFLVKLDPGGRRLWARQLGTTARDTAAGVSVDADGLVTIAGISFGSLGAPIRGEYDAFVARYDADGNEQWVTQLGTDERDLANSVASDRDGNVYIAGDTFGDLGGPNAGMADAYLAKLDSSGRQLWIRQLGSEQGDVAWVTVDGDGNAYLAGQTDGGLGGPNAGASDAFVAKYVPDGTRVWVSQLGGPALEYALGVTTSVAGDVWIAGLTDGELAGASAGLEDAFVARLGPDGEPHWTRQFGTAASEQATSIVAGPDDIVHVGGATEGDLGATPAGAGDAFVAEVAAGGELVWVDQFGTGENDIVRSVVRSPSGGLRVAGQTGAQLGDRSLGGFDVFLAAYE